MHAASRHQHWSQRDIFVCCPQSPSNFVLEIPQQQQQQRINSQTSSSTLTHTYTNRQGQYRSRPVNTSKNISRLIPTPQQHQTTSTIELHPTHQSNHAFLRLGTALPRQIHRRILQARQPCIFSTKKLIARSPDHDFSIHWPPTTTQHDCWQDIKSRSTANKHHVGGEMRIGPMTSISLGQTAKRLDE